MSFLRDLRDLLRRRDFARLYGTRVLSQTADGIFQVSLAAAVLFNPEHETRPGAIAAGFAVLLLPYSIVGPFAGVFLDRWRRRQVLVWANVVRTGFVLAVGALLATVGSGSAAFYAAALAVISVNRFYLAALSAALPHVVPDRELVTANGVTTTSGTLVALLGGGVGLGLRAVTGSSDRGSAVVAASSTLLYLGAAAVAAALHRDRLGPVAPPTVPLRAALQAVGGGLVAWARHVAHRPRAAAALVAIASHRFWYGLSLVMTLLLYRNYFTDHGLLRAGLGGLAEVSAAAFLGVLTAAVVTPGAAGRVGKERVVVRVLVAAGVVQAALGAPFRQDLLVVAAFVLGVVAQGAKICVDTIVQEDIEDAFRGRVFSVYDTLFNVTFVAAAVLAAIVLPESGRSYPVLALVAAGYLLTSAGYRLAVRRWGVVPVSVAPLAPGAALAEPSRP